MIYTNRYFKSLSSGEIFIEIQLRAFNSIMGATPEDLIKENLIEELDPAPSVADILKANGRKNSTPAIARYREINKVSGKEAADAVRKMVASTNLKKAHTKPKEVINNSVVILTRPDENTNTDETKNED